MERVIPKDLEKSILQPLLGHTDKTEAKYRKEIEAFEKKCEDSLIDTLSRLDIYATVKSDRYSLPYQKEIIVQLGGESYTNGPYEFYRVARKLVKELLNENVYKIRFYILVDVDTESGLMGKLVYKLRYYIH